ncbi:CCR4-NOT transcription complex subunit 2 isoform X2 [Anthonomus grandis grandis]|uniref:CCR4-NOT transcription complex subunit 2 isoform X2 n=1 Tax=Anthonomus grandis grandis TaxID=2921223 RepID=UPI002165806B|nr:CCR4-NOT transcription complex subunit 2 isoform X2 [Anthonomus grandis grandis]
MANLNFTRNIGGSSLGRSSVSFGGNSMSGHVTPVFGQRPPPERRTIPPMGNSNQMGNMNTTSMNSLGGYSSFNSVFGSGDANTPSLLDLSEFPSLTNRNSGDVPQPSPMPGAKPYVGMVKQPTSESSEFTMSNEDFPALPGTQNRAEGASPTCSQSDEKMQQQDGNVAAQTNSDGVSTGNSSTTTSQLGGGTATTDKNLTKQSGGIRSTPDGRVSNIPANMVSDQFGVVGLLAFIRAAESDPNLVSLALGQDLTALGLNLNSPENLYASFGGPWADHPCRPQDVDFHVPPEYLINHAIRTKLAPMKLSLYKDDVLFFMFYTSVGDVLQIAAAAELYSRDWRYHMEEKIWITQVPGMVLLEKTSTYERGTYYFFDVQSWRKVAKEFHLDYSKLEGRPMLNQT